MNILRFATKLNDSELARWVQAIGSIFAILSGFLVVRYQATTQRKKISGERNDDLQCVKFESCDLLNRL